MHGSHIQGPTRAVIMATAAGAVVATATMILPVHMLFALDAPVQADVRALIAFGLGAMTLMGATAVWLGRNQNDQNLFQKFGQPIEDFAQSTARSRGHLAIQMPWHQSAEARSAPLILNRLRPDNVDADIGATTLLEGGPNVPSADKIPAEWDEQHISESPSPLWGSNPGRPAESSIADMIDQFETAVAQRHQKLAELSESIFENMPVATSMVPESDAKDCAPSNAGDGRRPILELVTSVPVTDDDADSALAAALATLERITVRAR